MYKLLSLLAAGLFLTFLIGGEDRGQMRQGLIGMDQDPATRPIVREANLPPAPKPAQPEPVKINFTPVKVAPVKAAPQPRQSVIAGKFVLDAPREPAPVAEIAPEKPALPVMYVTGRSVNVRQGPSTSYNVVGTLTRAEAVTVVAPEQDGWVQIKIEGDGVDGYIAARLLTDADPVSN